MKKETTGKFVYCVFLIVGFNLIITSAIQRFKCKQLTETQLFLKLPENFIYKFTSCQ